MSSEVFLQQFQEDLADDAAEKKRIACCVAVATALSENGRRLWISAYVSRDRPLEGLAVLTEMSAELAAAITRLFQEELWYAGSALVRQVIEAEYLMWLMSQDRREAEAWLESSPKQVQARFSAKAMRSRSQGRFRDEEYWTHCDIGGHPNPRGRLLLRDHGGPVASKRWNWVDLCQHLERLWNSFREALEVYEVEDLVSAEVTKQAGEALEKWRSGDRVSEPSRGRPQGRRQELHRGLIRASAMARADEVCNYLRPLPS